MTRPFATLGAFTLAVACKGTPSNLGTSSAAPPNVATTLGSSSTAASPPGPVVVSSPSTPAVAAPAVRPGTLATGYTSGCAVASPSCVFCWGQMGSADPSPPARVSALTSVQSVAEGSAFACALLESGVVQCWGDGSMGQLGDGTHASRSTPANVQGIADAVAIAVGGSHACALRAGGAVSCWGEGAAGQLGDGARQTRATPVSMAGVAGALGVAASFDRTCVIRADQTVACAGADHPSLDAVADLSGIVEIALGVRFGCARDGAGAVRCWGDGSEGQLAARKLRSSVAPVVVNGIPPSVHVAAGGHTACSIDASGALFCWGKDLGGLLGVAVDCVPSGPSGTACDTGDGAQSTPTRIAGLSPVSDVSLSMNHACASANGDVFCWGLANHGSLGVRRADAGAVGRLFPLDGITASCR